METKLYVGNLSYSSTEASLQAMFEQAGAVKSVQIIKDRDSGRSKGFGFVEMGTQEEAEKAITMFNGKEVEGRTLTVNIARPREERGGFGGGDDRRRSYGGGSGGGRSGGGGGRRPGGSGGGSQRGGGRSW